MGENKDGKKIRLDPGLLFFVVGILYLVVAGYVLTQSDWNPRMPNYQQFLVNTAGEYTGGGVFEDKYVFLAVLEDNSTRFVVTDTYGEVLSAYDVSPPPATVLLRNDGIYFVFVEGNRIQLMMYDGKSFSTVSALSFKWTFSRLGPPRVIDGSKALLFAKRRDLRGIVVLDIDKNVHRPRLTAYFCRNCGLYPRYVLPDGSISGTYRGQPVVVRLEKSAAVPLVFSTKKFVTITDVCKNIFVGHSRNKRLVFGAYDGNVLYEMNLPVDSEPVCADGKLLLSSSGMLVTVALGTELNDYSIFSAYSRFLPYGVFEDVPYVILYGADSGNPSYVRNAITGAKCPDTPQQGNVSTSLQSIPLTVRRAHIFRETALSVFPAEPFANVVETTVDEDFRCYRP